MSKIIIKLQDKSLFYSLGWHNYFIFRGLYPSTSSPLNYVLQCYKSCEAKKSRNFVKTPRRYYLCRRVTGTKYTKQTSQMKSYNLDVTEFVFFQSKQILVLEGLWVNIMCTRFAHHQSSKSKQFTLAVSVRINGLVLNNFLWQHQYLLASFTTPRVPQTTHLIN